MTERALQPETGIDLPNRLALTAGELAGALGVSERLVRSLLPEIPHVYLGKRVVFPVEEVKRWMRERTAAEGNQADAMVEEILGGLGE